jgi:FKBP-type peptidyl-prolyl cis-trans isomerase
VPRPPTIFLLLLLAAALLGACQAPAPVEPGASESPPDLAAAADEGEPQDMDPRPVSRVALGGGLVVEDLVVGEGELCDSPAQTITVRYRGTLASSGTVFDGTVPGQTAEFPLGQLIRGWKEGVPGMRAGGTRRLSVPAAMAYGAPGLTEGDKVVIPPSADLVFEIELLGVR